MGFLFIILLVRFGCVIGTNNGIEGLAISQKDKTTKGRQPIYNSNTNTLERPHSSVLTKSTEGTILAAELTEDVPKIVAAFLQTGDSSKLRNVNCSKRYILNNVVDISQLNSHPLLSSALDTLIYATNFLNVILQTNKSREQNLKHDVEWYQALVRSILEEDSKIFRAVITFSENSVSPFPRVFLQATRKDNEILLQDLSITAQYLSNITAETDWFHEFKNKKGHNLQKRILNDIIKTLGSIKRDVYVVDKRHIQWSQPYLECEHGNYHPHWLVTISSAFYARPNLIPEFRGVIRADINLQNVDIDQCSKEGWFAGTNRCHSNSTECTPIKGQGFVLGAYRCICRAGFYHPTTISRNKYRVYRQLLQTCRSRTA
ncbi:probable G-protein coupled receptor 158 [Protopterus annectens]|uniref:probable G-protein coupled receptor 158 n=1 Tax=Protopterus annectens TaxID=7888 RepID=UPI001CF9B2AE|nr:probable G-protein coupled receptor 158 [Protopterus annectens]